MRWRAEKREGAVVSSGPVPQRLMDTWWLTDGKESFRMTSQFSAERLASYLNAPPEPRRKQDEPHI